MAYPALGRHPYRGLWAAVATMHGKERAIAFHPCKCFDMAITTAPGIDTDALGTFTGEIVRQGTIVDAARAKARLATERTGAALGIGSEGAFGPDPYMPIIPCGREVLVMREAASGHEIVVHRRTRTNFDHMIAAEGDDINGFLDRIGFPSHAVIVRPEDQRDLSVLAKGITELASLRTAIRDVAARAASGRVMIQTDMRAHLNPTRMAAIGRAAKWLAVRTARCCPACRAPGFGITDVERGLICSDCGTPTDCVRAEIHSCTACGHKVRKFERSNRTRAEARWCHLCNP
jgi:hypothetical protein